MIALFFILEHSQFSLLIPISYKSYKQLLCHFTGCILDLSGFSETKEFNRSVQGKWIYCLGPWTKLSSETTQVKGLCKKGNGGGGHSRHGVEGRWGGARRSRKGETVFWMYCMREESIFNNRKGHCSCETLIL